MTQQGLFITFEGLDGCGKTTQIQQLAEFLQQLGREVVLTRNPGGTDFGLKLREILLHYPAKLCDESELLLFIADRAQHMQEVVFPALEHGNVVLCDRHLDSTVAYQGYGRGLDIDFIHQLNEKAIRGRKPDMTFLLDGDPEILSQRVNKRGKADRLEGEALTFRQKTREGFLTLARHEPDRFTILDATQALDAIFEQVQASVQTRLSRCI